MLKAFQQLNEFIELNSAIKFQVLALEHHVITERSACGILPSAAQRQLLIRFRILQMIAFGFNQNHFSRFLPQGKEQFTGAVTFLCEEQSGKQGKVGLTLLFACSGRRPQSPLNA